MPSGKHLTAEQKVEIIRLRIDEGLPVWGIAKKFGLARTTVYNTVREWKKPDTVAAVTDSEQEDLVDVPANIVSQTTENVKDNDILPCSVVDAIADKIDMLYDKITECDRKAQEIQKARANAENDLDELKAFLRKNGYVEIVKMLASNAKWRALTNEN